MIDLERELIAALTSPEVQSRLRKLVAEEIAAAFANYGTDANRLVDVQEAARLMDMTPAALSKAAYRGSVPCERVGRRLRFRVGSILGLSLPADTADCPPAQRSPRVGRRNR